MTNLRTIRRFLLAVASRILNALMCAAKRWAAPGAGPKFVWG
jgi:hypothetical protein